MSDAEIDDPFTTGLPIRTAVSRPQPDAIVLAVEGELDTLTAPRMATDLDGVLGTAESAGAAVVVDLTEVSFLASSGLAVLVRAAHRAGKTARRLRLVVANRAVSRPLEVTGADTLFDVHAEVAAALRAVAAAPIAPPPGGVGR